MSNAGKWRGLLGHAVEILEATTAAPKWLAEVVRISQEFEDTFASRERPAEPSDFFYPH